MSSIIKVDTIQLADGTAGTIENLGLATGALSHRNLIINGDMRIAQRGTSFTPSGGTYTIDRWSYDPSAGLSWYTFIQNGDSLTPPAGFSNYIAITSTGANTPTSSQFSVFRQPIEGLNTAQLAWGTSDAKDITISFWVRSSLTGTFAGSLRNNAANYTYPFTYSISSANTWEKKTVNIAGPTSGTWLTTNGVGVLIGFNLGSGSNFASTANTWTTNWSQTATGSVNISETNGAKLYLTGVQLEVGSVATPFEHRSYGEELQRCERYYERHTWGANYYQIFEPMLIASGNTQRTVMHFRTQKRVAPSVTTATVSDFRVNTTGSGQDETCNNIIKDHFTKDSCRLSFQKATSNMDTNKTGYINAEHTADGASGNDVWVAIDAEL